MKKILVTGSSGYIGRHLCSMMADHYHVTGLDRIFKPTNIKDFITQDILENKIVEGHFDVVVHLAALVKVNDSVNYPMSYYKTNVSGTLNVLEKITCDHFIYASTGAAEMPTSPYALSKKHTEPLVKSYCSLINRQSTIFRFYNVIGAPIYPPTNMDGLMYNLIRAKEIGEFNLYGTDYPTPDGSAIRDYVHVTEICQGIINAIEDPNPNSILENLATGVGHSVKEIIQIFKEVNGCDFKVNELPRRQGDIPVSVLKDVSPYMQKKVSIEDMLKVF